MSFLIDTNVISGSNGSGGFGGFGGFRGFTSYDGYSGGSGSGSGSRGLGDFTPPEGWDITSVDTDGDGIADSIEISVIATTDNNSPVGYFDIGGGFYSVGGLTFGSNYHV